MRKTLLALSVIVLLSTAPFCSKPRNDRAEVALGREIAGTWLGTYEVEGDEPISDVLITTYHPDGTATTTSARAWGAGDPARNGLSSTHHLQWEPAGPREIRWTVLHFGHEADGNLRFLSRSFGVMGFDEAFEEGSGSFRVEIYVPDDLLDPLDPNDAEARPVFTAAGTSRVRRLHASIPGRHVQKSGS